MRLLLHRLLPLLLPIFNATDIPDKVPILLLALLKKFCWDLSLLVLKLLLL
jgi:hypothetical protein